VGLAAADAWRDFDIGRVVRVLRTTNEAALRFQSMKLHVRWWHASTMTMQRFLNRVGVSDQALALINTIVDTCPTCSKWVRPGPHNQVDINIPDTFNQQVELDLLFHGHHVVFHMIDRCTRWHAAQVVPDRSTETLINAVDKMWVGLHGPPAEIICDGERSIAESDATSEYCKRKGIKLHIKPPGQHAPYIERRGDVLRNTIVRLQEQCRRQDLDVPFTEILSQAVFCGNALTTVNTTTPYEAVYGRTPPMLPSQDQLTDPDESGRPLPGMIKHTFRLRELAI
jgi:hypothetical protein